MPDFCGGETPDPTARPTDRPTPNPTERPSRDPSMSPTERPTANPTTKCMYAFVAELYVSSTCKAKNNCM